MEKCEKWIADMFEAKNRLEETHSYEEPLQINWEIISANPNVTEEFVKNHPEFEWSYTCLSENPNISWDIVIRNPEMYWNFEQLCANPMTLAKKD